MTRDEIAAKLNTVSPETEEAIELKSMLIFDELGWDIIYAEHELEGDPKILGRTSHSEVLLDRFLFPALESLNPDLPKEAPGDGEQQEERTSGCDHGSGEQDGAVGSSVLYGRGSHEQH